jgi:hypothetical protein
MRTAAVINFIALLPLTKKKKNLTDIHNSILSIDLVVEGRNQP